MLEIADTFAGVGLTERTFQGAADLYQFVKDTSLGQETPEDRDRSRTLQKVITALSHEHLTQTTPIPNLVAAPHAVSH